MPTTPKIVTRSETTSSNSTENLAKGSKLTFAEMDSNFIELRNGSIGVVGDDSTGIDIAHGSTLNVAGAGGIATAVSGDTLTIDGSNLSSLGDLTAIGSTLVSPSNAAITLDPSGTGTIELNADTNVTGAITANNTNLTIVGDDSTGTTIDLGETFKIAGTQNITTAVSGDTLTLTGPDLSSYLTSVSESDVTQHQAALAITESQITDLQSYITDANLTIVGDDSTGVTFSAKDNDDITITGTGGITSTVSGNTITMDGSGVTGSASTGDLTFTGSTMSSPSNAAITLDPSGTGTIELNANTNVTGDLTTSAISLVDNVISTSQTNANLEIGANGTGTIELLANVGSAVIKDLRIGDSSNHGVIWNYNAGKSMNIGSNFSQTGAFTEYTPGGTIKDTLATNSQVYQLSNQSSASGSFKIALPDAGPVLSPSTDGTVTPATNQNITIAPLGTGNVILDAVTVHDNKISTNASNADLELEANGTGTVNLENLKVGTGGSTVTTILDEDAMGTNSATALATQQSIKAYVDANAGSANTGDITFVGSTMISPSNADITLNPAGTGKVNINAVYTLPNTDGSANQVLGTNGSGVLSFVDPTAINIDGGVADTTYTSVPTIDGGTA